MQSIAKFFFGLACGLLGAGILFLATRPAAGAPVRLLPPPTPAALTVQIDGCVTRPGVYRLPYLSRVQDGLQAAGGASPQADTAALNLAAPLKDGEKIVVPNKHTQPATPAVPATTAPVASIATRPPKGLVPGGRIHLNTASAAELESLPGIGPYLAQAIIDYRKAHGPFKRLEDLLDVPGIGPKTFERIKSQLDL